MVLSRISGAIRKASYIRNLLYTLNALELKSSFRSLLH